MTYITEYQQDEYARRWRESLEQEAKNPKPVETDRGGKPTRWPEYKALIDRFGVLTSRDFAIKMGISEDAAAQSLYNYKRKGMIAVVDRVEGITIWGSVQ